MNDYVLSCCSTADLSKERFVDRNIQVIYFHFMIGDEDYLDDCGEASLPRNYLTEWMQEKLQRLHRLQ